MIKQQKRKVEFKDPRVCEVLMEWWESLDKNRGDRADLRRCTSPEDVMFVPAYYRLRKMLSAFGDINDKALCIVAAVLSHAQAHDGSERCAAQLARKPPGKESPVMSNLRFRKFLTIRDPATLLREGIRAVRLLDGTVNIPDLARSLYWWTRETRKEWAFDYYGKIV
ncbi:MAG TPA: type I-E CRISPR-associated protein Cse2/CasB [Methanoregulaceae archaeon]|nr:type I-E CRISPR-associated protein Cse2/CasB [Methanolinea sp.]HOU80703.1 type I-E CRISPR-associated protein Cse2/CasB [Methanoregulaceae archaeon]HQJ39582.1 type I-E CRISPR-associated protein Cse2/CasB [Methanoregulaceae archaeon]